MSRTVTRNGRSGRLVRPLVPRELSFATLLNGRLTILFFSRAGLSAINRLSLFPFVGLLSDSLFPVLLLLWAVALTRKLEKCNGRYLVVLRCIHRQWRWRWSFSGVGETEADMAASFLERASRSAPPRPADFLFPSARLPLSSPPFSLSLSLPLSLFPFYPIVR